jgi:transposase InsO family protein
MKSAAVSWLGVELADAIFEYIEIFHNRRRRHSSLGMLTPIEFELKKINTMRAAA